MEKATNTKVTEMFGSEVNELKLGRSFYKNKEGAFHTIRYDFKPASIDHSKAASLEVKEGSEVNISFPNDESKGAPSSTNFKGPMKPCQKDCVLIYDHRSGEFTLERMNSNINVKIQRLEGRSKVKPPANKPTTAKPNTSQLKKITTKKTKQSAKPRPEPTKVEREPVKDLPPPSVSPPRSQRPPTPDAVTCTLSDESSPEPAAPVVSHRLSQDSSSSSEEEEEHEVGRVEERKEEQNKEQPEAGSSSSEENEDNSSSAAESSSEEEEAEEVIPQASKPKKARIESQSSPPPPPPPGAKARRGSAQIINQLQHDLSLSSSESDDSD